VEGFGSKNGVGERKDNESEEGSWGKKRIKEGVIRKWEGKSRGGRGKEIGGKEGREGEN